MKSRCLLACLAVAALFSGSLRSAAADAGRLMIALMPKAKGNAYFIS